MSIKLTKTLMAVAAGTMLASAAGAFDVTATVTTTVAVGETTPLALGSIYISGAASGEDAPTLTLDPATDLVTPANGDGKFLALGSPVFGELTVTDAAPFQTLTIKYDTTVNYLSHESGNTLLPKIEFTIDTFPSSAAGALSVLGDGTAVIKVGGTFTAQNSTDASTPSVYTEGDYTGTYDVTVEY